MNTDVAPLPPEDWEPGLRLLSQTIPQPARARHIARLLQSARSGSLSLGGLLGVREARRIVGVTWAQIHPGKTAAIWPPATVGEQPPAVIRGLIDAAVAHAREARATLAQVLLETDAGPLAEHFRRAGFEHLADLLYLVSLGEVFPDSPPQDALQFITYDEREERRLLDMIERSYEGTRDCPRLNGLRDSRDVLAGYQSVGCYDPSRWFLLRTAGVDVGCLLLTEHPEDRTWEVVYMGLVPQRRGQGLGLAAIRQAQWLARQAGVDRLVLAVDADNAPALKTYSAAGFVGWDRRTALVRFLRAEAATTPVHP